MGRKSRKGFLGQLTSIFHIWRYFFHFFRQSCAYPSGSWIKPIRRLPGALVRKGERQTFLDTGIGDSYTWFERSRSSRSAGGNFFFVCHMAIIPFNGDKELKSKQ